MSDYTIETKAQGRWQCWGYLNDYDSPREAKKRFHQEIDRNPRAFRLLDPNGRVIDLKNAK